MSWLIDIGKKVFEGGIAIFNFFSLIIITPIVSFYILRDWDVMLEKINNLIPKDMQSSMGQLAGEIDMVISSFIRGQMIVCTILAVLYSVGLSAIGLDFGLLVGTLTGFLAIIPFFGILIAKVILSERLEWQQLLGVLLITLAILALQLSKMKKKSN